MDRIVSEKIATKVIFSLHTEANIWEKGVDEGGQFISNGVIKVFVDTHEIYVLCSSGESVGRWSQLILNESDILRIHDVVYDIFNEPKWVDNQAEPIRVSLEALRVS